MTHAFKPLAATVVALALTPWAAPAAWAAPNDASTHKHDAAGHTHGTSMKHGSSHGAQGHKAGGSGLGVSAKAPDTLAVGVPARVTLTFDAATVPGATATVLPKRGVSITRLDGKPVGEVGLSQAGTTHLDVMVTVAGDGAQHFSVSTTQLGRTSVRAVPLKVGTGVMRQKGGGEIVTSSSGETIIQMQAK
jgi:hypothetical protein